MSTEYNDFGFTAMDADELAAIDTKIIEKTTTAILSNEGFFLRG